MFLKLAAFVFQAILPAAVVTIIAHLTALPRPEWQWAEYAFAAILIGFATIIGTAVIWRVLEWIHNLTVHRDTLRNLIREIAVKRKKGAGFGARGSITRRARFND